LRDAPRRDPHLGRRLEHGEARRQHDGRPSGAAGLVLSNVPARGARRGRRSGGCRRRWWTTAPSAATGPAFEAALDAALAGARPDIICLAGFMRILTPAFVARHAGRILNIHPSLLPKYPGLDTHARAIAAGDAEAGCSVHEVTGELDAGRFSGRRGCRSCRATRPRRSPRACSRRSTGSIPPSCAASRPGDRTPLFLP
jgi:phosphoribosylglycinamide formyltransferase 1